MSRLAFLFLTLFASLLGALAAPVPITSDLQKRTNHTGRVCTFFLHCCTLTETTYLQDSFNGQGTWFEVGEFAY